MTTTLLAIDPGSKTGHTGIVFVRYSDSAPVTVQMSWAVSGALEGFRDWYHNELADVVPDVVVCEEFVNWNVKGAELTPLIIQGAVQWLWPDVVLQPASGKNTLVTNKTLKRMGMWFTGDHHGDRTEAARHALIYLRNIKHEPTLKAMYQ